MIVAVDVHYRTDEAKAVAVAFSDWQDEEPVAVWVEHIPDPAPYVPGRFYERELPCIVSVLAKANLQTIDLIIIDGYVILDEGGQKGLGAYLYGELGSNIPVVGVAKSTFGRSTSNRMAIYRGNSSKALWVTAIGVPLAQAAAWIRSMAGNYRMPDILRQLDQETKR